MKIQDFSSLVLETIAAIELLAFYALKIHLVPIPFSQMHRVTLFSRGTAKVKGIWSLFKLHGFRSMLCFVQNYPSTSLLEQSLFRKFVGPLSVIAVIASFLSFSRNVVCMYLTPKFFPFPPPPSLRK